MRRRGRVAAEGVTDAVLEGGTVRAEDAALLGGAGSGLSAPESAKDAPIAPCSRNGACGVGSAGGRRCTSHRAHGVSTNRTRLMKPTIHRWFPACRLRTMGVGLPTWARSGRARAHPPGGREYFSTASRASFGAGWSKRGGRLRRRSDGAPRRSFALGVVLGVCEGERAHGPSPEPPEVRGGGAWGLG